MICLLTQLSDAASHGTPPRATQWQTLILE